MKIEINAEWRAKSWSYSSLSQYEQCPWQFYLVRAEKMEQEPGFALIEGNRIHALAEQYLKGNITGMPKELAKFKNEMKNLKRHKAVAEEELVLDRHWQPVKSETPWTDPKAWIRAKADARVGNLVVDFKTGKFYDKYREQADLYATILYQVYPDIGDTIDTEFWFTKTGNVASYSFTKSDQNQRLELWDSRASKMMKEDKWHPKKNSYCGFCHVQHHCEFFMAGQ